MYASVAQQAIVDGHDAGLALVCVAAGAEPTHAAARAAVHQEAVAIFQNDIADATLGRLYLYFMTCNIVSRLLCLAFIPLRKDNLNV